MHDGVLRNLKYRGHAFGEAQNFVVWVLENWECSANF